MKLNKSVFILGASSDIGQSLMKIYLGNDYQILAHYNKGNKEFFEFTNKNKNKIKLIKFNFLTSLNKIEKFLNNKIFKSYSVFINAVGYIKEIKYKRTKIKDFDNVFKINLYPGILLTKIMGEEMNKRKYGRIVNLSSIGVKFGGGPNNFPYSLSKHGLEFFPSETKKWAKNDVLINTVRIGLTKTKLHLQLPSKNLKKRIELIPIKRMATTREIADYVFYLASERNSYITNQVSSISGGE